MKQRLISPGNWTAHTLVVKNTETGIVKKHTHIQCDGLPLDMSGDVGVANGQLMATSKQLLEACESLVGAIMAECGSGADLLPVHQIFDPVHYAIIQQARAAIAAATNAD